MHKPIRLLAALALLSASLAVAPIVEAGPKACGKRVNDTAAKLAECVTLQGVRRHQQAFQDIADDNGGTRAAGTAGAEESVEYVAAKLQAAGYVVTLQEFPFTFVPPVDIVQIAPVTATYQSGRFTGSGVGNVTAAVTPVDINLTLPRANTSGCDAADFAGFPPGNIALIQRGTCEFDVKAANAMAAGAAAVIIFNQGNTPEREGLLVGTLGDFVASIPVVGGSFADGVALSQPGSIARIEVHAPVSRPQVNVIAESRTGNPDRVIMAGASLDTVVRSPGSNSNGSGSAALLEVAIQMAKTKPVNKVRFAFWAAEDAGLLGSEAYVDGLSDEALAKIELYLDFNVIGSPNYVFFVYDGDNSDAEGTGGAGPWGSGHIEGVFRDFYASRGESSKGADFTGFSAYGSFADAGIPSGGPFSGAFGTKTSEEAATWGGTAGEQYDPCYRLACDDLDNVSTHALDVNADAVAYAVIRYAMGVEVIPPAP